MSLRGTKNPTILTEDNRVPPLGDLWVTCHQAGVDIGLLVHSTSGLSPNLLAEVQERMGKRSCNGSKRQSIGDGERSRDEQWAVCLVFLLVEGGISIDNPGNVVGLSEIIERAAGRNRHELAVPHIGVLNLRCRSAKCLIEAK